MQTPGISRPSMPCILPTGTTVLFSHNHQREKKTPINQLLRQAQATIYCIRKLRSIWSVLSITLVGIDVKIIRTSRIADMFIALDRVQPPTPSATRCWIGPATIVLQDSSQTDHPRGELNVYKRDVGTEEEGALRVALLDNLGYLIL